MTNKLVYNFVYELRKDKGRGHNIIGYTFNIYCSLKDWWINGRSKGDGDGGNIISSGYHAVLLAGLSCCWTAVFLLFAFPPFLLAIKSFLPLLFHFYYLPTAPPKEIYNSFPDLFTRFSSPCVVHSSFFPLLLSIVSPLTSSPLYVFVSSWTHFWYHIQTVNDIHTNSIDYLKSRTICYPCCNSFEINLHKWFWMWVFWV